MISDHTPEELAQVFHASYEKSEDTDKIIEERTTNARNWYYYLTTGEISEGMLEQ